MRLDLDAVTRPQGSFSGVPAASTLVPAISPILPGFAAGRAPSCGKPQPLLKFLLCRVVATPSVRWQATLGVNPVR
jgi:hypothetical protein